MRPEDIPLKIRILGYLFIVAVCGIPFTFLVAAAYFMDAHIALLLCSVQACIAGILYVIGWTLGRQEK